MKKLQSISGWMTSPNARMYDVHARTAFSKTGFCAILTRFPLLLLGMLRDKRVLGRRYC